MGRKWGELRICQEALKGIAYLAMLLDHIGAVLLPNVGLRIIGRLAFPIFCFLLVEGTDHTKDPRRYGLRLLISAVISEVPYDLLFYGGLSWAGQNVMVTLLLGYGMVRLMDRVPKDWMKVPVIAIFALAAGLTKSDYGPWGILIIAMFALTRGRGAGLRTMLLAVICWVMSDAKIQLSGVLAMVPINLYNGRKAVSGRALQWAFYLFYPVHMLALWLITLI